MRKDEVSSIVESLSSGLIHSLGLEDWTIRFHYVGSESDVKMARCSRIEEYKICDIYFNFEAHHTPLEVGDSLLHELIHILHAPFDVYDEVIKPMLSGSQLEIYENIRHRSSERTELNIERMLLRRMKLSVEKIIELGKGSLT